MIIRAEPLTKEAFQPFGDVLETEGVNPQLINFGNTQKFGELAEVTTTDNGFAQLSIYRSSAIVTAIQNSVDGMPPVGQPGLLPFAPPAVPGGCGQSG